MIKQFKTALEKYSIVFATYVIVDLSPCFITLDNPNIECVLLIVRIKNNNIAII